jgi:hypothetical protein
VVTGRYGAEAADSTTDAAASKKVKAADLEAAGLAELEDTSK